MPVRIAIRNIPEWVDAQRLLGPGFEVEATEPGWKRAQASVERRVAADIQARLCGVGIGGRALAVAVAPELNRKLVRAARTEDARRRRQGSVGFSRSGVRLDKEGQISLTPESLALEIGKRAAGCKVVDACCGAGGNAIGFARAGCEVEALEIDKARLDMATHNARTYKVADRIQWRCVDATEALATVRADLLFIDPPWGEDYDRTRTRLADMPFLQRLLRNAERFSQTWIKLPPSFDVSDLPSARPEAFFGAGEGDAQRVKFLLLTLTSK
tara:strand:- start:20641 stop:21453 length:813 start_codon:yes stop_codon:yes gene_type:complete